MRWGRRVSNAAKIIRKCRLKDLETNLKGLEAESNALSEQINFTINAADQRKLEQQREVIYARMNEIESRYKLIEQELRELEAKEQIATLPKVLQDLSSLLTPVSFEIVLNAYQVCLAEGRRRPVPETLEELLQQLEEIPGETEEVRPLWHFVSLLIQEQSLDADQRRALQNWATARRMPPITPFSALAHERAETIETCLMVKVQPRSLNDPSLGYLLSAAIVRDPNPFKSEVELVATAIAIPEGTNPKCMPGYSQDELPDVLSELIATCGRTHSIPLTDLVVQWFLPIELMSLPIEHWQIRIGRSQRQCNGQRCKSVVVRSYDRHFSPDYQLVVGDWKKYWTRLLDCQESHCAETLVYLDPTVGKTTIDWSQPKVIGCKFVEHDDEQQQQDFWDNLLGQGVSIALWMRQSEAKQQTARKMMQSVTKCSTADLLEALAQQRQKALSKPSEADRLKAAPLCLLWDNPFRPFPSINYQSDYQSA
jgi:hypothetical protein